MTIHQTDILNEAQKDFIFHLWNREYPERLNFGTLNDLDVYLSRLKNPNHYLVSDNKQQLAGWATVFEREDEQWFAMIFDSKIHRQGLGTSLLKTISKNQAELNGWVIDHNTDVKKDKSPYPSPLNFYLKNNFVICKDIRLETDTLSAVKIKWKSEQSA
jgi:hypothetical protein